MPGRSAQQLEVPLRPQPFDEAARARVSLGSELVSYTIRRSRRRSGAYTIAIDERGMRISVARNATPRWIESVLRKHEPWILRKLAEWQHRRMPPPMWREGTVLMYLGSPLRLTYSQAHSVPVLVDGRLLIDIPGTVEESHIASAVTAWLRQQALACFRERIAHYAPALHVTAREVRLSSARTRWGSCHPDGRILLNWRLIQMPLPLVDYVVVHELAHLREMNHSPRFWRAVKEAIPDCAARRKEIRDQAHRYLVV